MLRCRFFVCLKYARLSAFFCKTHITGAVCTKIQRAEFLICAKQTADSAPSFGTKSLRSLRFLVYRRPPTVNRLRARGTREERQKIGFLFPLFFLSLFSLLPPPLFSGIFFNTREFNRAPVVLYINRCIVIFTRYEKRRNIFVSPFE